MTEIFVFIEVVVLIGLALGTVVLTLAVQVIPSVKLQGFVFGLCAALPFAFTSSLILINRMGGRDYQVSLYLIVLLISYCLRRKMIRWLTR